jgi:hypothetical protein
MGAVFCLGDLVEGAAGAGLHALGQRAQDVGDLMDPTALLAGGREDLAQRGPQPQRPVTHHDHRGANAPATAVPQQLRPGIGRLPLAVGDRHQLLGAVGAHPHQHQAAQPAVLQPQLKWIPSAQQST